MSKEKEEIKNERKKEKEEIKKMKAKEKGKEVKEVKEDTKKKEDIAEKESDDTFKKSNKRAKKPVKKKNNTIGIILIVLLILLIAVIAGGGAYFLLKDKKDDVKGITEITKTIENYTIHVNTKDFGNETPDRIFSVPVKIKTNADENGNYSEDKYEIGYMNKLVVLPAKPNYTVIELDGKEYYYTKQDESTISLYYKLGDNSYLEIQVESKGTDKYNKSTNTVETGTTAKEINYEFLATKEISRNINFDITKENNAAVASEVTINQIDQTVENATENTTQNN